MILLAGEQNQREQRAAEKSQATTRGPTVGADTHQVWLQACCGGCQSQLIRDGSRLEAELNARLLEVHQKLMQAGFDQKQTEREAKLKETLANLQRIFPGA
jgi:hypothetical protein